MDSHSPLDYSRDRSDRGRMDLPKDSAPSSRPPEASPFETVARAVTPARAVFNPKLRHERALAEPGHSSSGSTPQVEPANRRRRQQQRPSRTDQPAHEIGLHLRPEERRLLLEVGKFRVITSADLAAQMYAGSTARLRYDLEFLKQAKLIELHSLNARRNGKSGDVRRFEAVTLTKKGRKLLIRTGEVPDGQRVYSDLVKPREAEHDAQIYRAYLKEFGSIEKAGGQNVRVRLDFELKAQVNRSVYLARKADPDRDLQDIKKEVAEQFHLHLHKDRVVVPDARLEYDLPNGGTGQVDIEVATAAYRHGHIAAKASAGFKMYISNGDIGRLGAGVQDDHDLMSEILDI